MQRYEHKGYQVYLVDPARAESDGSTRNHPAPTKALRPVNLSHPGAVSWLQKLMVFSEDDAAKVAALTSASPAEFVVKSFPLGYQLYEQRRANKGAWVDLEEKKTKKPPRIDLYLYGHPSGGRFRSPHEFQTHWMWLWMPRGEGEKKACGCNLCRDSRKKA